MLYDNWAASWFGTNAAVPEIAAATRDPDGDSLDNDGERIAGTDPTRAASTLAATPSMVTTNSAPRMALTVEGKAGRSYTLERTLSLATPDWNEVVTTGVLSSNQALQIIDPEPLVDQGYYRVAVTKP